MVPKKARDFRKPTAEELGLPEELVNDFLIFYWEKVRKMMSGLDCPDIHVPNLGIFHVKHWKIPEILEKHKTKITLVEGKFHGYHITKDLTDRIEKLEKIKKITDEREVKFKEIKDARKAKANLEKQGPDMGGPNEQDLQEGSCGESI